MRLLTLAASVLIAVPSLARAQDEACQSAAGACTQELPSRCLSRLGAGVLSADEGDACADAFTAYRQCLTQVAASCEAEPAPSVAASDGCSPAMAREIFIEAKNDNNCLSYQAFIDACPKAGMAGIAKARMQSLGCDDPEAREAMDRAVDEKDHETAQRELKRLGFYQGAIDGAWGPKSMQALSEFERFAGIDADGVLTQSDLRTMKATGAPVWAEVARVQALDFTRFTGEIHCEGQLGVLEDGAKTAADVAEWREERRSVVYRFEKGVLVLGLSAAKKTIEKRAFEFTAMKSRGITTTTEEAEAAIDIIMGEVRVSEDELFFQEATLSRTDNENTVLAGNCRVVDY